jgi:hypothetical protein
MPAPTPTGENKLTSSSMIPGDSYNTKASLDQFVVALLK